MIHAAHVLSLMHQCSPNYHKANFGAWWFAVGSFAFCYIRACHSFSFYTVGIGALRHLKPRNDWSKRPSEKWIQITEKMMTVILASSGSSVKGLTNMVTREFLDHWNVRKQVDLTKLEMWKTPPIYPADTVGEQPELGRPVAAVFNAQTFDAAARSHQPTSFSVDDVYEVLTDSSAGLAYLSEAEVRDVSCYLWGRVSRYLTTVRRS